MLKNIVFWFFFFGINTQFVAQKELEIKINEAYALLQNKKIKEAYELTNFITTEYEKDTIKYVTLKKWVFYLNALTLTNLEDYPRAIEYFKQLIPLCGGQDLIKVFETLVQIYLIIGKYEKALNYQKQIVEKDNILLEENHPQYFVSLNNLSDIYSKLGQYDKALEIQMSVAEKQKWILGENHPYYLISLNNLATIYSKLGQYNKALEIQISVAEKQKVILGENHLEYLIVMNNLGEIYSILGHYDKALEMKIMVAEKRKEILGENHPHYLISLNNLADIYRKLGQYDKALEISKTVAEKLKEILGVNHPDYLVSLNNLASSYSDLGENEKALEIIRTVADKRMKILGENHPDYLLSLNNLALCYSKLGQYNKALEINFAVNKKLKENLGENHPAYLRSFENLANIYSNLGQYYKAMEINITIVEKVKGSLGENHPDYLTSLNNLANNYSKLGQNLKALEINKTVVERRKRILGENHPDYLVSYNNLASSYSDLGENEKALQINKEIAEKQKDILGENHPDYFRSLNNLSNQYYKLGHYQKALEINITVAEKVKGILGENHPDYLISLNNLTSIYYKLGQYEKALEINIKVAEKEKGILGEKHPDYIQSLENLALIYDNLNQKVYAFPYFKTVINSYLQLIKDNFNVLTENEKEKYFEKFIHIYYGFQSFSNRNFNVFSTLANDNFDLALESKGQILRSTINIRNNISNSIDSSMVTVYDTWIMYKKMIEKQSLLPVAERSKSLDTLVEYANTLERQLVKASTYLKDQKKASQIRTQDVYHYLDQGEVAIEFINYRYYDKFRWTDSVYYAAMVLSKADTSAIYMPLFEEKQLDSLLTKKSNRESFNINTLYKNRKLFDLIWKPLSKYVEKGSTIYYSPSGLLNQIHLASIMESDSTYLSDSYHFHTMSTTGKIALPKTDKSPNSVVVFGGMQYDIDEAEITRQIDSANDIDNFASRSFFVADSTRSGKWAYLAGTLEEANNIIHLAKQKKLDVKSYLGATGIEENFKHIASHDSPSIIHIGTHGFFFPDPKKDLKKLNNQMLHDNRFVASDNPLNRSGLLFSGANKAWTGDSLITGREDGILTALEVSSTSLLNTDLVVLSACETGLGTIKGSEGVYGLQRAFKMAGVTYLLMSLWKVPDNATQEFMTSFYAELLTNKKSISDAYNTTQKQMRNKYRNEPYKWAGFVLME